MAQFIALKTGKLLNTDTVRLFFIEDKGHEYQHRYIVWANFSDNDGKDEVVAEFRNRENAAIVIARINALLNALDVYFPEEN